MNKINNWYKVAVVGLTPFDGGELTDKVRYIPEMGGDSHFGKFAPTDSDNHGPNDYFSESNNPDLTEEQLEKIKNKKKKKKKILLKKIKEDLIRNTLSNSNNWYKTAQWGKLGPILPTFGADDWIKRTYKKVKDIQNQVPIKPQKKKKNKRKEDSSLLSIESDDKKALAINNRIVITSSSIKDQIKVIVNNRIIDGTLLVSNNGLAAIALKEKIEMPKLDNEIICLDNENEISIDYIKSWLKDNNIIYSI